jgi:hypothetical protein
MSELLGYSRTPILPPKPDARFMALPIALLGVVSDWITTRIGLDMGYHEIHLQYSPFFALAIFWYAVVFLLMALPRGKKWDAAICFLASWSFLGAVNNALVILGVFSGLVI